METQPFEFIVSEPERKDSGKLVDMSYWAYHVHAKTTLSSYANQNLVAVRRFSDFAWLREHLVEEYPGILVPPIPEKEMKGTLEKFVNISAQPLLEYRQRSLRKFLVRTGAHPVLFSSKLLQDFLEMDEDMWARRMKSNAKKKEVPPVPSGGLVASSQGFLSKLGFRSSGGNADTAPPLPPIAGAAQAGYTKAIETGVITSTTWSDTLSYVSQLDTSLLLLKDRVEALIRRRKETAGVLKDFGRAFARVGEIEAELEASTLSQAMVDVGHHSEHLSLIYIEQGDQELVKVAETLTYYIGMCSAVKEVVRVVQGQIAEHERVQATLTDCIAQRDKLVAKGAPAEKRSKLEADIATLGVRKDEMGDLVEKTQATFREELRRFHREKQYDIKQTLKTFVELQLEYSTKMRKSWEVLVPQIEQVKL